MIRFRNLYSELSLNQKPLRIFLTSILDLILYRSLKKFQNNLLYTAISDIKASSIEIRKEKEFQEMPQQQPKSTTPYKMKKGESYMNNKQLAHFRKILEDIKLGLGQDIDRTVHTMQDEATVFADPNDRASQESDMALELRNRDRERKLIKKINETIAKIDSDDYGYCDTCGIEIGLKRLEARPTATLCIDCKTLDEIRERQLAK